jgi:hypothetical protein
MNVLSAVGFLRSRVYGRGSAPLVISWLFLLAAGSAAFASELDTSVSRASDFTLIDHRGKAFNLHYHAQTPAVVLVAHDLASAHLSAQLPTLTNSYDWAGSGIITAFINPVPGQGRAQIDEQANALDLQWPVLRDEAGLVSETLALRFVGEALLIDPRRWQIIYRGPVLAGDQLAPAFNVALQALLAGEQPSASHQAMAMAEPLAKPSPVSVVSYSDSIAPVLLAKCADCHRPGGIAPWAMNSHAMVQGFSPMIRETVLTRRMPPWHADPEIGEFLHDLSLTLDETRELVTWIDAGAPRGDGPDPLTAVDEQITEWELGQPDLIVTLPAFDIPATGVLDYQFFEVENPLDRDVWVRAVQIAPGDRQVVHHAIATFGEGSNTAGRVDSGESLFQPQLMTFVPGNETYIYPDNTGVYVPAGTSFYTQMHYTTFGRETKDQTRIGLYFHEQAPEHVLQHYSILNLDLRIPAGEAEHQESAYFELQRDAVIYSLFPHAHYRGRASEFTIRYPDGREELVLSVPNYDFNWQRYFQFKEPIHAPAGTMIIHRTTYDNSTANVSNPDPAVNVRFGEQTWEEMLYGGVSFRYAEPGENDQEIDIEQYMTSIVMGFMDSNMDGKISLDEMPEQARQALALPFTIMDRSKTGGLEFDEFKAFMTQSNMMNRNTFSQ